MTGAAPRPAPRAAGDRRDAPTPAAEVVPAAAEVVPGAAEGVPAAAEVAAAEPLLPVFLKLRGRDVLLVGGGVVAEAKLAALVAAGARVTVVAPEVRPALRAAALAAAGAVHQRPFSEGDLDGCWFVVAAAPAEVNRRVQAAAEARRLFVNAVDDPAAASAYSAATIRRGPLTLAISTSGLAPALAGLVREGLESLLPDELERWGEIANQARAAWKRAGSPMAERRPLLLAALNRLYQEDP